jgi:hypothetical protein
MSNPMTGVMLTGPFIDRWRSLDAALTERGEPAATFGEAHEWLSANPDRRAYYVAFLLSKYRATSRQAFAS